MSALGSIVYRMAGADIKPTAGTTVPDSKVRGANMGPIWGRQDPGGPHAGPMNFAIWGDNHRETLAQLHTEYLI